MARIVILGAAESGIGAAVLAQKQGFDVFVSDKSPIKDKYKQTQYTLGRGPTHCRIDLKCRRSD